VLLAVALLAISTLTLSLGAVAIPPSEVLGALGERLGLGIGTTPAAVAAAVVWDIRLPRLLMAISVGAAFSITGAALQGMFRNRLADPYLLGIAPGGALGGVTGATAGAAAGAIAGGAVGGMLTALVLKRLSRTRAGEPSRFILTGLALGLAITAWVGFIVFTADRARVPPLEFWLLGNLAGTTWNSLATTAMLVGLGTAALFAGSRALDLLVLGESDARRLGLDVDLSITVLLLAVGAVAGAAVGGGGIIVFTGLLGPHIARRLVGPTHRRLLATSVATGALLVATADLVGRTIVTPIEIPVGLLMAAVGGPFFLWLIRIPDFDRT